MSDPLPPLPPLPVGFSGGSLGKMALRDYAREYALRAVIAEREACAVLVESLASDYVDECNCSTDLASAIRGRG